MVLIHHTYTTRSRTPFAAVTSVCFMIGVGGTCGSAHAQNWVAVSLHPPGATSSTLNGLDAARQAGSAVFAGRTEAVVWSGSANSYTNLHPNNLFDNSSASGFVNGMPTGTITDYIGHQHAVKWPTSGSAYTDLMPENCAQSAVWSAGDGQMCGWAQYQSGPIPGGYWTTNYASWISLTAPNATRTYATDCGGGQQVGWAVFSNQSRACLWSGSSATYANLQPTIASNLTSAAFGTDGVQQVGYINNSVALTSTACVWTGSAASVVYLNPPGVARATAYDVCGNKQVGVFTSESGASHACLWRGSSESMEDLHAALPAEYSTSFANAIVCVGNQAIVGGTAYNSVAGRNEAVIWIDVSCPSVTSQPSSTSVCPGDIATFDVSAMGNGTMSFAWQYMNAGGAWSPLVDGNLPGVGVASGTDTSQLSISDVISGSTTSLRCVISNGCGDDAISSSAVLTGLTFAQCCSLPSFEIHPVDTSQCQGGTALFTSLATGVGPFTYRWQWEQDPGQWENLSNDTIAGIGSITGSSSNTLTISNVQGGFINNFRARATNSCGQAFSAAATLTGFTASECCSNYTLDWSPTDWIACAGDEAFFELGVTSNGAPTFQWQRELSTDVWSNLTNGLIAGVGTITDANTSLLHVLDVSPNAHMRVRCVVTHNCGTLTSDIALLTGLPDCGPTCDSIDFNNDTSLFDPQDIDAFLSVYSEGPCIPEESTCNDIDFNNDGSVFDPCDIDALLLVFSEGPCTMCGQ